MKFIKGHKLISVLLSLLFAAIIILALTFSIGSSGSGVFNRLYMAIEKPMTSLGSTLRDNLGGAFSYRQLMKENEKLKEENSKLKQQVNQMTLTANELQKLKALEKALNYDFIKGESDIVTAKITSFDGTNWTNSFVIDRGSESKIQKGNIVIYGQGLVGRVIATGKGWSKILPIIDESSKISFCTQDNKKSLGILEATSNGTLTGYMLDSRSDVGEGDIIITSGRGEYPAGIIIGKVSKTRYDSDKQLLKVEIKPETDFASMDRVSVIL